MSTKKTKISISPLFFVAILVIWWFGSFPFFVSMFIAVLFHELSHVIIAKFYGARIEKLRVLPFGGQIELDTGALSLNKKIIILLSGAGGNIVFALSLGLLMWLFPSAFLWFEALIWANAIVAVANLLPIPPLDGGKILRLVLFPSKYKPRQKTGKVTEIAIHSSTTLIQAYKKVNANAYTKFVVIDKGQTFYESDLENFLTVHDINKPVGEVLG